MDAIKGIFSTIGSFFSTVSQTLAPYLSAASNFFSATGDVLVKFRVLVFLLGFFGLMLTFLWFFFRYLDKKRLTMPAVAFTLFFFMFLGGNILMISHASGSDTASAKAAAKKASASTVAAETVEVPAAAAPALPTPASEPGSEDDGSDEPAMADAPALPGAAETPADAPEGAEGAGGANV